LIVGLIEDVAQHTRVNGFPCSVRVWLDEHPQYDTAQLREAAEANTAAAVWRYMKTTGYEAGQLSVTRHLRGDCKCP
jgi:hypothetical protein